MYIAKQLVLYPKRLKSSNVEYNKCVRAMIPALFALILKDVAILNLKPFKIFMYQFLSASGLVGLTPMRVRQQLVQ